MSSRLILLVTLNNGCDALSKISIEDYQLLCQKSHLGIRQRLDKQGYVDIA